MIIDRMNLKAIKEDDESLYEFCSRVYEEYWRTPGLNITCDINGIQFICDSNDNVESLVTKYTELHKKATETSMPEKKPVTKIKMFWTIDGDGLERSINEFISDKEVIDIKYSSLLVNLPDGHTAVSDRGMVIYKEAIE